MITASNFADAIGRMKMAQVLGVGATAVSNAVVRGVFPASWLSACTILASESGQECPPELFGQKGLHNTPNVDSAAKLQGRGTENLTSGDAAQGATV